MRDVIKKENKEILEKPNPTNLVQLLVDTMSYDFTALPPPVKNGSKLKVSCMSTLIQNFYLNDFTKE